MRILFIILLSIFLIIKDSFGQNNEKPQNLVAIKAKNLIDVNNGTIVADPVVLIMDGRISQVGANLKIPDNYYIINLDNATLLPGLIDCHTHLLHRYDQNTPNALNETSNRSTSLRTLMGSVHAREMLEAGFTTVRDLGNSGLNGDVALRDAINFGWVLGPRMIVSTRAIGPIGGQFGGVTSGAMSLVKEEYVEISGVEEARAAVRSAIYYGANCIKVIANAYNLYLSKEEIKTIVDEAHRLGLKVAAHATGGQAIANCIDAGVDSIEHGYDLTDEELKSMAEKNIFLVPTDEPNIPDHQKRLSRAIKAGVPIAAGADVYYFREGTTRGQRSLNVLFAYLQSGMTPLQVIQTATINAGNLLGYSDHIGSVIEAGKPADIIAVEGDLLNNLRLLEKVGFVMKDGKVILNTGFK